MRTMTSSTQQSPQVLLTSAGRDWGDFEAELLSIPAGVTHLPGGNAHSLGLHVGPPVGANCLCGGQRMRRVQRPGDIDIVPAGVAGTWEDDGECRILRLSLAPSRLREVAEELGRAWSSTQLLPRLQVRDARIEGIAMAIKADLEADVPSEPLYIECLANALAVRLIETASGDALRSADDHGQQLSSRQLRRLTDFIETNLAQRLHLADLAEVVGVGVTRLKTLFRNSTGVSVHQYVIRRRVEYARALMTTTTMPTSDIAVAAGFAHQSHLTSTMRRLLGQTPGQIVRQAGDLRPKMKTPARI
jgi:AraC family transcriptional regulator